MRKIIVTEFMSLDGVFEGPGAEGTDFKYAGWTSPYGNEEFGAFKSKELDDTDILLLGRITYDAFAEAWPKRHGDDFSDKFNSMPKYVVSNTLEKADWKNSHIIKGDIVAEIKKLKEGEAPSSAEASEGKGNITVHGSGKLTRFLIENGLVDEMTIMVFPVVLGEGKRLFDGIKKTNLKLISSKEFTTGIVVLSYQPE